MKDKNGRILKHCDEVKVPEPNGETDIHIVEFIGTIADILYGRDTVIVEDNESDFYEIEANRLEIVNR